MLEQSGKRLVTQDNELIEACYGLSLNEKRLLLIGISRVNSMVMPDKTKPLSFSITAQDWQKAYPDTKNPYVDLKRASKDLQIKYVTFRPKADRVKTVNWVDNVLFYEDESRIDLQFGWTMSHYLQGMINQFTSYDLLSIQKLTSIHSIRLYELLSQYRSTGYRVETIENLKFSLDIVGSYEVWQDLKKWVIQKAVDEINAKSDYAITYEPIKKGRKVTGIKFYFKESNQADLFK